LVIETTGIATTAGREISISAAFDGTNYLVGIQGDAIGFSRVGAQLVSQSGSLVGPLISTGRTGGAPNVAFGGSIYLMIWEDDQNDFDLYGQLITPSGSLSGTPFLIKSGFGRQSPGGIGFDGTNFLVLWKDNDPNDNGQCDSGEGTCEDVYGQLVTTAGALLGPAIPISTQDESQKAPAVAFDGTNYLVAWASRRSGPELWDVYGRFISKTGELSDQFMIGETPSPSYNPISIAFDGENYFVVWNRDIGLGYPNPTIWDIYGRMVSPSGSFPGPEFAVSTATGSQAFPFAAFDGMNYLVSWTDARNDSNNNFLCDPDEGTCADIHGQFVNRTGGLVGSEFPIAADAGNQFISPVVFGGGKYLVVWTSGDSLDGSIGDVYGAFIEPAKYAGDFNKDGDVDGGDLAEYINDDGGVSLADFAENFGKSAYF
jgi:hypothetical protein